MFFAVLLSRRGSPLSIAEIQIEFCLVRISLNFVWRLACVFRRADVTDLAHRFGSRRASLAVKSECLLGCSSPLIQHRAKCASQVLAGTHVFAGSRPVVSVNRFLASFSSGMYFCYVNVGVVPTLLNLHKECACHRAQL